ncbi:MAG: hypothetical protein ABIM31_03240 [candidate division WOR-3 bacterium]
MSKTKLMGSMRRLVFLLISLHLLVGRVWAQSGQGDDSWRYNPEAVAKVFSYYALFYKNIDKVKELDILEKSYIGSIEDSLKKIHKKIFYFSPDSTAFEEVISENATEDLKFHVFAVACKQENILRVFYVYVFNWVKSRKCTVAGIHELEPYEVDKLKEILKRKHKR